MFFFFDQDEQVAGHTTTLPYITLAAHTELHTILNTGRNVYGNGFFAKYTAFSFTAGTLSSYGYAFAMTGRAGCYRLHLSQERALYPAYLAAAATGAASLYRVAVLGAAAVTGAAMHVLLYFDLFGSPM